MRGTQAVIACQRRVGWPDGAAPSGFRRTRHDRLPVEGARDRDRTAGPAPMGVEPLDPADPTSIRDLPQAEIYTVRQAAIALGVNTGLADELPRDGFRPSGPADTG